MHTASGTRTRRADDRGKQHAGAAEIRHGPTPRTNAGPGSLPNR